MSGRCSLILRAGHGRTVRGRMDASRDCPSHKCVFEVQYNGGQFKALEDATLPPGSDAARAVQKAMKQIRRTFRERSLAKRAKMNATSEPSKKASQATRGRTSFRKTATQEHRFQHIQGKPVIISGLKKDRRLNGQEGVCKEWDAKRARVIVNLANGEVKAVRRQNVIFKDPAAWSEWLPATWGHGRKLSLSGMLHRCFIKSATGLCCWFKCQVEDAEDKKLSAADGVPNPYWEKLPQGWCRSQHEYPECGTRWVTKDPDGEIYHRWPDAEKAIARAQARASSDSAPAAAELGAPSLSSGSALAAPEMSDASVALAHPSAAFDNAPIVARIDASFSSLAQPNASNSRLLSAEELEQMPQIFCAYHSFLMETKSEGSANKYLSCLKQLMIKDSFCPDAMATSAYVADVSARPENKSSNGNLKVAVEHFGAFWNSPSGGRNGRKVWPELPHNSTMYQFRRALPKVADAVEPEPKRARVRSSIGLIATGALAQPSASSCSAPVAAEVGAVSIVLTQPSAPDAKRASTETRADPAASTALTQPSTSSGRAPAAAEIGVATIDLTQPSACSGSAPVAAAVGSAAVAPAHLGGIASIAGIVVGAASIALPQPSGPSRSADVEQARSESTHVSAGSAPDAPEISAGGDCVICMERQATHCAVPCGCRSMCEVCANLSLPACPCCRTPIEKTIRVFLVSERDQPALVPEVHVVDGVHTLVTMGFPEAGSRTALRSSGGDLELAIAMLCSE